MKDMEERLGIKIYEFQINHGQFYCEVEISFYDPKTNMRYGHKVIGTYGEPIERTLKCFEAQIKHGLEEVRGEL